MQHRDIVDAIVGGNGDAAYRLLFGHVTIDSDLLAELVANLDTANRAWPRKGRPAAAATQTRARVKGGAF